jgi:hypothetical protein
MKPEDAVKLLLGRLAGEPAVKAVARCGKDKPLPEAGESDIDIFVYCSDVPGIAARKAFYDVFGEALEDCSYRAVCGGRWGDGDCLVISGVETWVMYVTLLEAEAEADAILHGPYEGRTKGGFYPTGRLAMLLDFDVLYDDGFLSGLRQKAAAFPRELEEKLLQFHTRALSDEEDLARAVLKKDVLFYHFALESALDHFLIPLFALNGVYFPSRKRNIEAIGRFLVKPEGCEKLLLDAVVYGSRQETLGLSLENWRALAGWMKKAAAWERV